MEKGASFAVVMAAMAMVLAMTATTSTAQSTTADIVNIHNAARSAVGVPPLSWDDNLAAYAQSYANQRAGDCRLEHSDRNNYQYGENLSWSPSVQTWTAASSVNQWVEEKSSYDYASNSCIGGAMCGHYTQVVWRDTTAVGCAAVACNGNRGVFFICSYYPAGNVQNQRPMAQKAFAALVLLVAAATLAIASTAAAQSSPQDFLDAHNAARRGEGVGLPDVVWNTTLQAFAENYVAVLAATCRLDHSNSVQLGYGENLYMGGAGSASTAADAVGNWMEEKASYVYSSNTCTKGRLIDCGHYTQIVWRSTTSIGCARAVCSNGGAFALVLLAATLAMASTAAAQNSPQDFLDAHNAARRGEGVGLPDVVWNTTLEAFAQSVVAASAGTCNLRHSSNSGYGENLYWGPAGKAWTAADAVSNWMEEKAFYVYSSNTCTKGSDLIECGHYTQIVWRSTTSIGCARAVCNNGDVIISCNYFPPGNLPNERPY
uniref:SCP domain-containing protein n=1 Tax=Oryza punctata TaxID=4537 RepID=A0A0E0LGN5_ORYPU